MTNTLANVARKLKLDPKQVRAKLRRHAKARPFDHTKISSLTAKQVASLKTFMNTDFRG